MRRLSRYRLVERIASGAASEVYLAALDESFSGATDSVGRLLPPGTFCALKVLKQRPANYSLYASLLEREAGQAVRFRHPASGAIYEVGRAEGEMFTAAEYIRGRTLAEVLLRGTETGRPLAREIILWLSAELASALNAAHRTPWTTDTNEGIIHGELSPPSVTIGWDGSVKLLGLGIGRSRFLLPPSLARLPYRAPEAIETEKTNELADIYSLGVQIYDALCGDRVFRRPTIADTRAAVLRGKFDRLETRIDYVSEIVVELVWQMMSRWPASRPQSAEYVERALRSQVRATNETMTQRLGDYVRKMFAVEMEAEKRMLDAASTRLGHEPTRVPSIVVAEEQETVDTEPPDELLDVRMIDDVGDLDRDTLQISTRPSSQPTARPTPSAPSDSGDFGGKTEPMMRMQPPAPEPTFDDDALVRPVADRHLAGDMQFPVERSNAKDPFEESTPVQASMTNPLPPRPSVEALPNMLPPPEIPEILTKAADPTPPAMQAADPTSPDLAFGSPTTPMNMTRMPPPRAASSSSPGTPATMPPPRAPSSSSPGTPAPRAPSKVTSSPQVPVAPMSSGIPRTPSNANQPLPRANSRGPTSGTSRPLPPPEPEETTAPIPRSPSTAGRTPPGAPTPVHTPAPKPKGGDDFLTAADLLADLLDGIESTDQVRARSPSVAPPKRAYKVGAPPQPDRRLGPVSSGGAAIAGSPMSRPALTSIARYELSAEIGRTGASHLYEGRSPTGEPVVVKVLDQTHIDDPRLRSEEWTACFGREVSIARKLSFSGLPRLIEAGQEGNLQYIVYDRVEGVPLNVVIGRGKLLDPESLRRIITHAALSLAHMHERGFVYCNVQAQHVLMTRDGLARLNDLSLASPIAGPMHPLLGTNTFALSPEWLWGQAYQPASDQFALGALLYELLTNTRPFRGLDDRMLLAAIKEKDPLPPHTIDSRVNPFLSEVAMRALQKQPDRRFPSCEIFAQHLGAR